MTPLQIKIAYLEKGLRFSDTARRLGVASSVVSRVIHRLAWSVPTATAVAEDLGMTIEEVFPERIGCMDRRLVTACGR